MKKILALLILLTLVVSVFAACKKDEPTEDPGTTTPPATEQGPTLEDAKVVLRDLFANKGEITPDDFDVVAAIVVGDVKFTVTWATNSTDVVIAESTEEGFYTVDVVPAEPEAAINYTLTATIAAADGSTITTTFNFTVPKFQVNTYAEYVEAEADDPLVVEGVVYGIMSKAAGDQENSVFVQDLNGGGYYVYGLTDDPSETGVQVGQTVRVRGIKAIYNGTLEIKNASIEIRSTELTTVTPTDLTAAFTAASTASNANLLAHLGEYVVIKGVTVLEAGSNGYYYFELDGIKTYLRISSSSNCTTSAQETTIKTNHADKFYFTADVAGIAAIYQGNFYIMPVDDKAFDNFSAEQLPLPDDVKANMVKDALTLPAEFVLANPYTLPATGAGDNFSDVAIAWALAETTNATLVEGVLTPVLPESGSVNIVLTATITKNNASVTKEFTIAVKALEPISIEEANTIAATMAHDTYTTEKYLVVGTVKEIQNTQYGNIVIEDAAGKSILVYGSYSADGATRFDGMATKPSVGDTVKMYGVLGTYNGTNQMKNAWLLEFDHTVVVTVVEATCNEAGYTKYEYKCECGLEDRTEAGEAALGHNFVEGVCSRCGAQDHQHSYTSTTTDPTCTAAGVITYTCACNDSYTEPGEAALGHEDTNGDYKCDRNCGEYVLPAEGTTLTIAEALKIAALYTNDTTGAYAPNLYYIEGKITELSNLQYGNCKVQDETGTIDIYGLYDPTRTNRYDKLSVKPVVGDTVKLYGEIGAFKTTIQMNKGGIIEHTAHDHVYGDDGFCFCGAQDPNQVTNITTSAPITSVDQLTDGCKIIIASGNFVMGGNAGNFYNKVDLTANADKSYTFASDSDVDVVTVEKNADGTFALKSSSGYLMAVKGQNYLKYTNDKTVAAAKWTIEMDGTNVHIYLSLDGENREIKYNPSSPRFSAYKSGQNAIVICLVP